MKDQSSFIFRGRKIKRKIPLLDEEVLLLGRSNFGGGNHRVETAFSLVTNDSVVSFFAPGASPGVTDGPERSSVFFAVSDDGNTVVQGGGVADRRVGDSAEVQLHPLGVDTDGQRTIFHQGRESGPHLRRR